MAEIRCGIIGLGVGEQYIPVLEKEKDCRISVLCDLSEDRLGDMKKRYPKIPTTKNADELFRNSEIDALFIASYDDIHYDHVMKALGAGKHVFVEKPMCRTTQEAKTIKAMLQKQNGRVKLASNLVLRTAPLFQWLREEITSEKFGEIYSFDGEYLYGRIEKITKGWRKDVENYSAMQGGGIHLVDLLLWLTGQRPTVLQTRGNRISTRGSDFKYNDFVTSLMEFPSGLLGRITANFGCVHPHQHVIRIFGTKKTFIYDDAGPRVYHSRDEKSSVEKLERSALPATKGDSIPDFLLSIRKKNESSQDAQMFFDGISVCAASDDSLKTSSAQQVSYI